MGVFVNFVLAIICVIGVVIVCRAAWYLMPVVLCVLVFASLNENCNQRPFFDRSVDVQDADWRPTNY